MKEKPRFTLNELVEALNKTYSVGTAEQLEKFYDSQVAQYPLYPKWMDKILEIINKKNKIKILEYGFGPGYLTKRLLKLKNVIGFVGVEPHEEFIKITSKKINKFKGKKGIRIVKSTAELFKTNEKFDFIICQASYHHMVDKLKALKNMYEHLEKGGTLIIAEVFFPEYKFNNIYEPIDKVEYIESVSRYTFAQILAMPNPTTREFKDQVITWFLDLIGIDEHKVCIAILKDQLRKTKFKNVQIKLLKGNNKSFDWEGLGYYFITATNGN